MFAVKLSSLASGGEKVLSLAKLHQHGFPVPDGFVLTQEAYERFRGSQEFPDELASQLVREYEELSVDRDLRELGGTALDMITAGRGKAFVAVRGRGACMLNVRGIDQLKRAVADVWAHSPGELLVQKMLTSDVTGATSPHPVADARIIESSWGLALENQADLYIVRHDGIERRLQEKEWFLVRDSLSEKTVRLRVIDDRRRESSLSEENINALLRLAGKAEELLGGRQMLEFGFERNKPFFLQAISVQRKTVQTPARPDGKLLVRGDVVCPGHAEGVVKRVSSHDVHEACDGCIIAAETFHNDLLKANPSGLLLQRGTLQKVGALTIPALRTETLPEDGQRVFMDAVNGKVYTLNEHIYAAHDGRPADVWLSLASQHQQLSGCGGAVIRAETLLTNSGKHPALLARESPSQLSLLLAPLEQLARDLFPRQLWYRSFEGRSDELQNLDGAEEQEKNPALGMRGVRRHSPVFQCECAVLQQLYERGLHNISLILPFVSDVSELRAIKERIHFPLKIGIAVETPAAALQIEDFCREGIFSVQLDIDALTQLTLGMDQDNPRFSHHFSALSPGVEKLAGRVLETCRKYRVAVSIQGEACNSPDALARLNPRILVTGADNMEHMRTTLS